MSFRAPAAVVVLALLSFGLVARGVRADEGPPPTRPPGAPASKAAAPAWLAEAFGALRVRMEARLEAGRLLEKQGRFDEALATYRTLDDLWSQGLEEVRRVASLEPGAGAQEGPSAPRAESPGAGMPSQAVARALEWLAAHQNDDGSWSAGKSGYEPGLTGLALLAFQGAGVTDRSAPRWGENAAKALRYLLDVQDPEGCFGPRTTQHYVYNHAIASLAVVEAFGLTKSPLLKGPAQKALDFVALCRNPYSGWRYGVKPGDSDTSVTSWMVMVQDSARSAGDLRFDPEAFEGARAWVEKMTDPDYGRVGYITRGSGPARSQDTVDRFPSDKSESMTAAGILIRLDTGEDARSEVVRKGLHLMRRLPPVWNAADGSIDMYYWFLGTLANRRAGGEFWRAWEQSLRDAVLPSQRRDGTPESTLGSWDPLDPWGPEGGRVYSTALMALCLEVTDRHEGVVGAR